MSTYPIVKRFPLYYRNPFRHTGYTKFHRTWTAPITPGVPNVEERDGRMIYIQRMFEKARERERQAAEKLQRANAMASGKGAIGRGRRIDATPYWPAYGRYLPLQTRPMTAPSTGPSIQLSSSQQHKITDAWRELNKQMINNRYYQKYGMEKPAEKLEKDIPSTAEPLFYL